MQTKFHLGRAMMKILALAMWFAVLAAGPFAGAVAFDHPGVARRALERHIVPAYERLNTEAAKHVTAIAALCQTPSAANLEAARAGFKSALIAWGHIEHIRFGPISEQNRYDSMLFWPDPRGISRRHITRALSQQDPDVLVPESLATKSVALQGFTALDTLLFSSESDALKQPGAAGQFRCGYARALAVNIERIAQAVREAWSNSSAFAHVWLHPGPGNPAFLKPEETTHALGQAYLMGLENVRNIRLGGPLGFKDRNARPLTPVVPYSGLVLDLAIADIEGLRDLLLGSGLAEASRDGEPAHTVMQSVTGELQMMIPNLRKAAAMSPKPFQDANARNTLILLGYPLKNTHDTVLQYLKQEAGLTMGFNSLDGD